MAAKTDRVSPIVIASAILALTLVACSQKSAIETTWTQPDYAGGPFEVLGVIALAENAGRGQAFESAVSSELGTKGIRSIPGFTILGDDTTLTKEDVQAALFNANADGALIFKLVSVDSTQKYIPSSSDPLITDQDGWLKEPYWNSYSTDPAQDWSGSAAGYTRATGTTREEVSIRIESSLYRVSDARLVWSAVTGTTNPADDADLARQITDSVVDKLRKENLIAK